MSLATHQTPLSRSLPSSSSPSLTTHLDPSNSRTPTPSRSTRRGNHFLPSDDYNTAIFSFRPHHRYFYRSTAEARMTPTLSPLEPRRVQHPTRNEESFDHESFEWEITGVQALADHVSSIVGGAGPWQVAEEMDKPEDLPEALRTGWVSSQGLYKFDLARTEPITRLSERDDLPDPERQVVEYPPTLSLYIRALGYNGQPLESHFTAGVFVGIVPAEINAGQRYAQTRYLWSSRDEHEFSPENDNADVMEVTLPPLTDLLNDERVKQQDAFFLCIWIGQKWDIKPNFKIPDPMMSSTISSLRRLLDRKTGDVKFVCLEHIADPGAEHAETSTESNDAGGHLPLADEDDSSVGKRPVTLSRKRVLYGDSVILEEKSDYFKDMLTGGFSESERYTTIYVESESFGTLYWVLRFLYTNELLFAIDDDVRQMMNHLRLDTSEAKRLLRGGAGGGGNYLGSAEWAYHRLPLEGEGELDDLDVRTMRSVSSAGTGVNGRTARTASAEHEQGHEGRVAVDDTRSRASSNTSTPINSSGPAVTPNKIPIPKIAPSPTRYTAAADPKSISSSTSHGTSDFESLKIPATSSSSKLSTSDSRYVKSPTSGLSDQLRAAKASAEDCSGKRRSPVTTASGTSASASTKSRSLNNLAKGQPTLGARNNYVASRIQPEPDPHAHPATEPPPASALEVYVLADRYRLDALKELAKEHILSKLTSENCVPMAFATYHHEIHDEVLDFVVNNWYDVKYSQEFLRCIKEVREDVWGENGPMVLHNIFQKP